MLLELYDLVAVVLHSLCSSSKVRDKDVALFCLQVLTGSSFQQQPLLRMSELLSEYAAKFVVSESQFAAFVLSFVVLLPRCEYRAHRACWPRCCSTTLTPSRVAS